MVLPRIKIKLPVEEKLRIDARLIGRGYLSFSEYVRDLIRQDLALVRVKGFKTPICHVDKPSRIARKQSKKAAA
jgi:Arc/MetJ-type ribon-helix-helix transcriptional regulator